jgi:hypothetical protein
MIRYRIKLVNAFTKESVITPFGFTNKEEAVEWATKWRSSGDEMDCEILDSKNNNKPIKF